MTQNLNDLLNDIWQEFIGLMGEKTELDKEAILPHWRPSTAGGTKVKSLAVNSRKEAFLTAD